MCREHKENTTVNEGQQQHCQVHTTHIDYDQSMGWLSRLDSLDIASVQCCSVMCLQGMLYIVLVL